jgi:hypothetical protein
MGNGRKTSKAPVSAAGSIILKLMLERQDVKMWAGLWRLWTGLCKQRDDQGSL